ncbi:hypothetical protein KM043_006589 [Ampulex compressa]|nr:hypothetical protein KM043_006589 [Ampulex compressa]
MKANNSLVRFPGRFLATPGSVQEVEGPLWQRPLGRGRATTRRMRGLTSDDLGPTALSTSSFNRYGFRQWSNLCVDFLGGRLGENRREFRVDFSLVTPPHESRSPASRNGSARCTFTPFSPSKSFHGSHPANPASSIHPKADSSGGRETFLELLDGFRYFLLGQNHSRRMHIPGFRGTR